MRGAASATAGSQKCPSSASSQPRRGTTSESRKATKSVLHAASPVLRAAAGPLLRGCRMTSTSQCAPSKSLGCHRYRRAVVDDHDPHAAQRHHQPVDPKSVVAHRNHHGDVPVRRTAGRPRVRDGGVEQRAGELGADRVAHLEPAAVEQGLRRRREPQQPGRRAAEQRRARTERAHPAVDLDGEPVGQPRLGHVSIPSAVRAPPTDAPVTQRRPSRRRCVRRPPPSPSSGHPAHRPRSLRRPPRAASGASARPAAPGSRLRQASVRTSAGEICSNTDVSVWPAWASPSSAAQGHQATSRPSDRKLADRRAQRLDVAAVTVDEDQPARPVAGRAAVLDQHGRQRRGADRDGPGKALVLAGGAVGDRGRHQTRSGRAPRLSSSAAAAATAVAMRVSVSSGRCGPCCSVEPTGIKIAATCRAAVPTSSPQRAPESHGRW